MITPLHQVMRLTARFSLHDCPPETQTPILEGLVIPRIVSSSMAPALRRGDRLELVPTKELSVGDVIVFRRQALFICHRIVGIGNHRLHTKGDAGDGPAEDIDLSDVIGRVSAIVRDGRRLPFRLPPPPHLRRAPKERTWRERIDWCRHQQRTFVREILADLLTIPFLGPGIIRLLMPLISVDVMERSPIQSFVGYFKRGTVNFLRLDQIPTRFMSQIDLALITLVIRLGPFILGTCTLSPWSLHLRPAAVPLGLAAYLLSLRPPPRAESAHR